MINTNHIIIVIFLFLLFNYGIKKVDKVIFIFLAIFIVYFFVNNKINLKNIVNNSYDLDTLFSKIKKYDKINVELIINDIKYIKKYNKEINNNKDTNTNIKDNIDFLKNRIHDNLQYLYLNYRNYDECDKLISEINNFLIY